MAGLEGERQPYPMFFSPLEIDLFLPIQQTPCILNQWMKDERYHLSETHWSTQESRNCLWTWIKILYVHAQLCVIQVTFTFFCFVLSGLQPLNWEIGETFKAQTIFASWSHSTSFKSDFNCFLFILTAILSCEMLQVRYKGGPFGNKVFSLKKQDEYVCFLSSCIPGWQLCFSSNEDVLSTLKLCKHVVHWMKSSLSKGYSLQTFFCWLITFYLSISSYSRFLFGYVYCAAVQINWWFFVPPAVFLCFTDI